MAYRIKASNNTATPDHHLPRGVHVAPWKGDDGELVLLAITAGARLAVPPVTIPHEVDRLEAADALWELLDGQFPDPRTLLRIER